MIGKTTKGKGFKGVLAYTLAPEKGVLLDTNLDGETPAELAAEFRVMSEARAGISKPVVHVSLSLAPGEHLSDEEWRGVGQQYLEGMGFSEHQYVLTRHTNTEQEHVHLVTNRIGCDGSLTSDSHERRRMQTLLAEIELDYGLQEVLGHRLMEPSLSAAEIEAAVQWEPAAELEPSAEIERPAELEPPPELESAVQWEPSAALEPSAELEPPAELERPARPAEPTTRETLQLLCDASAQDCPSFTEYAERLAMVGVELIPTVQQQGAKLSGVLYCLDGETMKGSDVGKAYAAAGIQARGISYEQARDYEAVEGCRARAADRAYLATTRRREALATELAGAVEYAMAAGTLAPHILAMKSDEQKAGAIKEASALAARAWKLAASGRESGAAVKKTREIVEATYEVIHVALDTMQAGPPRQAAVQANRELAGRVVEYRTEQEAQQRALSRGKNKGLELEP